MPKELPCPGCGLLTSNPLCPDCYRVEKAKRLESSDHEPPTIPAHHLCAKPGCDRPGTLNASIREGGFWYCRFHFQPAAYGSYGDANVAKPALKQARIVLGVDHGE